MKAQMFKLAGVKTEKAFYKKFPTEEAFIKVHGKAFKKAQMGAIISGGEKFFNPQIMNFRDIYDQTDRSITGYDQNERRDLSYQQNMLAAQQQQAKNSGESNDLLKTIGSVAGMFGDGAKYGGRIPKAQYGGGFPNLTDQDDNNFIPGMNKARNVSYGQTQPILQPGGGPGGGPIGNDYSYAEGPGFGEIAGKAAPIGGKLIKAFQANKAEKEALQGAKQWRDVSEVSLAASRTRPEQAERKYVRPEDIENTGEEFFPIYGVGTNVLAKYGGNIPMAQKGRHTEDGRPYKVRKLAESKGLPGESLFKKLDWYQKTPKGKADKELKDHIYRSMIMPEDDGKPMTMTRAKKEWLDKRYPTRLRERTTKLGKKLTPIWNEDIGEYIEYTGEKKEHGGEISEAQGGGNFPWEKAGNLGGQAASAAFNNNAGSQFGSAAADVLKVIPGVGPVASAIAKPVFTAIGGLLDRKPAKIKKARAATDRNMSAMTAGAIGQGVQQQYNTYMKDGGNVGMDGDLIIYDGEAETISKNPYLPEGGETVQFKGPSHEDGGMPISYGESPVEVEGGEPAVQLEDGGEAGKENLVVFGNLQIPKNMLDDPKAKGKKFKNYVKDLSKKEDSLSKRSTKNIIKLGETDTLTRFGKIKEDTLKLVDTGIKMQQKDLAAKKMDASALQKAINDTAEEQGIVADDLAKGKYKVDKRALKTYAKYGQSIPKAQDGIKTGDPKKVARKDVKKWEDLGWKLNEKGDKLIKEGKTKKVSDAVEAKDATYKETKDKTSEAPGKGSVEFNKAFGEARKAGKDIFTFKGKKYTTELYDPKTTEGKKEELTPAVEAKEAVFETDPNQEMDVYDPEVTPIEEEKPPSPWWALANQGLEYFRPSDAEGLDYNQLAGEMYALSSNQLEPVQAQSYKPRLKLPYDVSFQDRINEITAQTRGASKLVGYNPAAQAMIAGQSYEPINKIKAEEFRANQAMRDSVTSSNIDTVNQAKLTNLGIYDKQYERQAIAKSKTKDTTQAAISSMSDKFAKNKFENRQLQVYENLYKYRYDSKGRAINMNPIPEFNMYGQSGRSASTP